MPRLWLLRDMDAEGKGMTMITLYQVQCGENLLDGVGHLCKFVFWIESKDDLRQLGLCCPACRFVGLLKPTGSSIEFEGITEADDDVLASKVG